MKAALIHRFGEPEVLSLEEVAVPTPATAEVLVRVRAAGINLVDLQTRAGLGVAARLNDFPIILGWDLSGVIESVGHGVERFKVGDQVYGMPRFPDLAKAYAEFTVAPEKDLAFKPKNLTHLEAATMPLAALTAHQALEVMNLRAGQTVLVHAAAGDVGQFAVQLARVRGAQVIGTAPSQNQDFVRQLGAAFLDDTLGAFEQHLELVDAVLDTVGGELQIRSFAVVKPGGWVVSTVDIAPDWLHFQYPTVRTERILIQPSGTQLEHLAVLVENNQLKPVLGNVFPLEEVIQAHRLAQSHQGGGKIVLELRSGSP
jgi:NADPH:quinone reductase-like Zn-dependent oxidoreductase